MNLRCILFVIHVNNNIKEQEIKMNPFLCFYKGQQRSSNTYLETNITTRRIFKSSNEMDGHIFLVYKLKNQYH